MNPNKLTIGEAHDGLARKQFSATELVESCLSQIDNFDSNINAYVTVNRDNARKEAIGVDSKIAGMDDPSKELGILEGIPYGAKDAILTEDIKSTASSNLLKNFIAPFDATVIKRLKQAGAILIGKENQDAYGHGASTENSDFFVTKNPWDKSRVAGGSSGGGAAAVASDMTIFSLGEDTGGSVRQPSALCGVTGLRPSYGRVPRYGCIAYASSFDTIGPITKTVSDNAIVLNIIAGLDKNDHTTRPNLVPNYKEEVRSKPTRLKFGIPKEMFNEGVESGTRRALEGAFDKLRELGHEIVEISLPLSTDVGIATYYLLTTSETSSNLARLDGVRYGSAPENPETLEELYTKTRTAGFGSENRRRIMLGTYALSAGYYDAYYKKAQKVRTLIRRDFDKAFQDIDFILSPTSPFPAFKVGEKVEDPLALYLADINNVGFAIAGLPTISIPAGFSGGLPVGLQITGKYFDEVGVYKVAHQLQSNTDHHLKKPDLSKLMANG